MSSKPITVSVTRTVAPGRAKEAAAWARAGQELASSRPGYLGSGWIRRDPESSQWHMLYRFADEDSLSEWEKSPERVRWVDSAVGLVEHSAERRRTGIEGWFDEPTSVEVVARPAARPVAAPPRWKQMITIIIAFYPLSLIANWALSPLSALLPLSLRVLVLVLVVAPIMTYVGLPAVTRLLRPWLTGAPR